MVGFLHASRMAGEAVGDQFPLAGLTGLCEPYILTKMTWVPCGVGLGNFAPVGGYLINSPSPLLVLNS